MNKCATLNRVMYLIALTLILSMAAPVVSAQAPVKPFEVGIRGGVSWANFDNTFFAQETSQVRKFTAGGFVRIPVHAVLSIQPEINYVRKGATLPIILTSPDFPEGYGTADYEFRLDYIQLSPMLRLTPKIAGPVKPSLLVGPCFAYNLLSKNYLLETEWEITNASTFEFGIQFGAVVQFDLSKPIFVDFRYSIGMTDAYDLSDFVNWEPMEDGQLETPVFADVKSQVLSITAGIVIF